MVTVLNMVITFSDDKVSSCSLKWKKRDAAGQKSDLFRATPTLSEQVPSSCTAQFNVISSY